ncbi:MAG TPA: hypothetical protein VIR30_05575 [Nocardioides sp.]
MNRTDRRECGEDGEDGSALVEVTWLSILLMVPLVYVLISVFTVQSAAFGTSAASRAAGRAFSIAESEEAGERQARLAAEVSLRDQGVDPGAFSVEINCSAGRGHCHQPGSVITVIVRTQIRLPLAPDVLGGGAPTFRLDAKHSVPYGEYRAAS